MSQPERPRRRPSDTDGGANAARGLLERGVAGVLRHARTLSVLALLSAVLAGLYAANGLEIDSDTDALFSRDLPFQRYARALEAEFPALRRQLVILIEGDSPAVAHRAVL